MRFDLVRELLDIRSCIFRFLDENSNFEKRFQKYLLMSDDIGCQSLLYLLLKLSDDELKGIKTCMEAAARALSIQSAT